MHRNAATMLAGAIIGAFLGSSMGLAVGGTAYNAAYFFSPLGAFIGWLIANRRPPVGDERATEQRDSETGEDDKNAPDWSVDGVVGQLIHSIICILASAWNFHIDVFEAIGVLPLFVDRPWLFFVFCILVSLVFPPFLVLYFAAFISAGHFGADEKTNYRATIR